MPREYGAGSSDCPTCEKHDIALSLSECLMCEKIVCQHCGPDHAENHAQEAEDDDPPCECVRVDVDQDDASDCPLHGPHGPVARYWREQEAKDEAASAARIPFLLGLSIADMEEPF